MSTEHPITPPPELVRQWHDSWFHAKVKHLGCNDYLATQAARWGWQQRDASVPEELQKTRDTELDACCEWLSVPCPSYGRELRNARRSKPPSLAEQAFDAAKEMSDCMRAALERLKELEDTNG